MVRGEATVLVMDRQSLQLCHVGHNTHWPRTTCVSHFVCVFACVCLQNADLFTLTGELEDGKGKCPYDPAKGHTGLIVGEYKCVG